MKDENLSVGSIYGSVFMASRVESLTPTAYRLVKRNGELLLQGAYQWTQGVNGGVEWRDIPTIEVE